MATKKAKDKAVKKVGKAVRKAVHKGVTEKVVEQAVEDAIVKSAEHTGGKSKKALPAKKVSKAAKKAEASPD
jgi:hypothetical protein